MKLSALILVSLIVAPMPVQAQQKPSTLNICYLPEQREDRLLRPIQDTLFKDVPTCKGKRGVDYEDQSGTLQDIGNRTRYFSNCFAKTPSCKKRLNGIKNSIVNSEW